jgi:hypothetical protein
MTSQLHEATRSPNDRSARPRWLLLIHQIPPKPNYLRVKIGRRLQRLGAVAIKNSVYALPKDDQTYEDFQWVVREIVEGGGDASVVEARFVDGMTDEHVEGLFHAARESDYSAIVDEARKLALDLDKGAQVRADLTRLRRRLAEIVDIDFFGASGREAAEALLADVEARVEPTTEPPHDESPRPAAIHGRVWVTRKGIKIDRIGSAWLIRNFIDQEARFKFVPGQGYEPSPGELRFDMFEADYTHEGDRCTFEVLLQRFGLADPALRQIAEIVHDIDLKDGKFGRKEAPGLDRLIAGFAAAGMDDESRLAQGGLLFATLYESFKTSKR